VTFFVAAGASVDILLAETTASVDEAATSLAVCVEELTAAAKRGEVLSETGGDQHERADPLDERESASAQPSDVAQDEIATTRHDKPRTLHEREVWVSFTPSLSTDGASAILADGSTIAQATEAMINGGASAVLFNCAPPRTIALAVAEAARTLVALGVSARVRTGGYANMWLDAGDRTQWTIDMQKAGTCNVGDVSPAAGGVLVADVGSTDGCDPGVGTDTDSDGVASSTSEASGDCSVGASATVGHSASPVTTSNVKAARAPTGGFVVDPDLDSEAYVRAALKWRDDGASVVGGCCGIGVEVMRAVASAIRSETLHA
jgi:S-methylmethionine-dependent homocysteine/selenocysteine methylase